MPSRAAELGDGLGQQGRPQVQFADDGRRDAGRVRRPRLGAQPALQPGDRLGHHRSLADRIGERQDGQPPGVVDGDW
jgi:hypothetical protein